jgi:hypothetical protein
LHRRVATENCLCMSPSVSQTKSRCKDSSNRSSLLRVRRQVGTRASGEMRAAATGLESYLHPLYLHLVHSRLGLVLFRASKSQGSQVSSKRFQLSVAGQASKTGRRLGVVPTFTFISPARPELFTGEQEDRTEGRALRRGPRREGIEVCIQHSHNTCRASSSVLAPPRL